MTILASERDNQADASGLCLKISQLGLLHHFVFAALPTTAVATIPPSCHRLVKSESLVAMTTE